MFSGRFLSSVTSATFLIMDYAIISSASVLYSFWNDYDKILIMVQASSTSFRPIAPMKWWFSSKTMSELTIALQRTGDAVMSSRTFITLVT